VLVVAHVEDGAEGSRDDVRGLRAHLRARLEGVVGQLAVVVLLVLLQLAPDPPMHHAPGVLYGRRHVALIREGKVLQESGEPATAWTRVARVEQLS
jgi:hypothetical protein